MNDGYHFDKTVINEKITVDLTNTQVGYLKLLLADDVRKIQDTEVTKLNKAGLNAKRRINHSITDILYNYVEVG